MKKLSTVARVTEVDAVSNTVLRLWAQEAALQDDAFLKKQFAALQALSDSLTEAVLRERVSSRLDEADSSRDEALRGLADLISGSLAFRSAEKKAAAFVLKAVFDKYGKKIAAESYARESALVESLLKDLESDAAKKALAALDFVGEMAAVLRVAQNEFDEAYDEWAKSQGAGAKKASATEEKKLVAALINDKIAPYLSAMADDEKYVSFSDLFEREIERTNAAVLLRGKQKSEPAAE